MTSGKWQRVPVPIFATGGNSWERQIDAIWKVRAGKKRILSTAAKFSLKKLW